MKAIDIETTGLVWQTDSIVLIGAANALGACEITPSALLCDEQYVWHNGKFDIKCLKRIGIDAPLSHDTLIAASLLPLPEDIDLSLEGLSAHFLHYSPWQLDWGKGIEYTREQILEHCLNDCKATLALWTVLKTRLESEGQYDYYIKYAMPFNRLLADVEYHGIKVDFARATELRRALEIEVAEVHQDICGRYGNEMRATAVQYNLLRLKPPILCQYYEHKDKGVKSEKQYARLKNKEGWMEKYGEIPSQTLKFDLQREQIKGCPPTLNLDSHTQLRAFLEVLGVFLKDKEGKPTTNKHEMEYHVNDHPILCKLLSYRDSKKQISFLESWESYKHGDRIHTNYNMAGRTDNKKWKRGARTGRLTSSEPNLQQVDKRMRELFIPDEDCVFVGGDFDQIEMRLIAHFCEDNKMRDVFRKGVDFYGAVAIGMFGLSCKANDVKELYPEKRFIAKTISLAIPYGMWAGTLAYRAKLAGLELSEDEARQHLNEWYNIYKGVRAYKMQLGRFALQNGYVRSIYGRKVYIPREEAEHKALDYRCQSSGHEMTAYPQLKVQPKVADFARSTFWLHDETWYNCKNDKKCIDTLTGLMRQYMVDHQQRMLQLAVPITIDIQVIQHLGEKT